MNTLNKPIDIRIDQKGFVAMTFTDNLTAENLQAFKAGLEVGANIIRQFSEKQNKKIKVLVDLNAFSGEYDVNALEAFARFVAGNKSFVEKSATWGGSDKAKAAGEISKALANRNNIALFDTKEKASEWLGI
jgi:DNA topoisomerase IB